MQISSIETFPVRVPLKPERRMVSALGRHEVSDFLIVRITADNGLVGVGEATVTPRWSGETVWGAEAIISEVMRPVLLGCDLADVDDIDHRVDAVAVDNWFAKSAIEMACWDIKAKAAQCPLFQLLGGACRPLTIRNRFSLGAYPANIAQQRAVERVAAGFSTIKIKVGTDPKEDILRVRAVREAVGEEVQLTIDANGGWNYENAVYCLSELADCNLSIIEQPLPRRNFTELKRLKAVTGCKILADESCFDEIEAIELIEQGCCDALTLYPGKQGGIGKAQRIASIASAHSIPCTIGSNLEWDIATAAMLHFIVATPNLQIEVYPGDCLGPFYHEFSVVKNSLVIDGPLITLPDGVGLGVDVDWDIVHRERLVRHA